MFTEEERQPVILIVDDDVFMRGMLQNLLEGQGYTVVEAQDGMGALEEFQRSSPDLVLLDAAMPVMDGFTACAELKKLETAVDVPVIMITSLDDEHSVDQAFTAGAVEYITKPVHWAVLKHRVHVILSAKRAQLALRSSEARFRGVFEQASMGIALVSMEGDILHTNPTLQKMLGIKEEDVKNKAFNRFFYPCDTVVEKEFKQQLLAAERNYFQMEKYFFRKDSPMLWGRLTTSLVKDAEGTPQYMVQMIENITERKRAQAKQRLASKVFETTSDSVMITNAEGNIVDVNQSFLIMTKYSYDEVLDQNPRFLQSGQYDKFFYENMWSQARETGRWRGEILNRRKDNEIFNSWMSMSAVRGEHNEITHYVAVYSDVSTLKEGDERIRLLTHYDSLTELPNRLLFHEYLTRACRQEERLALLYLDLDDFKHINENFGYDISDEFLQHIANELKQCVREGDTVARLDGDEFGIIISPLHQDYDTRVVAEAIFERLNKIVTIQGHNLSIDGNIGITFYPQTTQNSIDIINNVEILVQHADMAMYLAKETGKNTYYVYEELEEDAG